MDDKTQEQLLKWYQEIESGNENYNYSDTNASYEHHSEHCSDMKQSGLSETHTINQTEWGLSIIASVLCNRRNPYNKDYSAYQSYHFCLPILPFFVLLLPLPCFYICERF